MWWHLATAGIGLLAGIGIGNLLSLVTERLTQGAVALAPRSCGSCGAPLPLAGRLPALRSTRLGACARCGARPPASGLWLEAITVGTAAVLWFQFGAGEWPAVLVVLWLAVAASAIDLRLRIIPNRLLLGAALLGLLALIPLGLPAYGQGALGGLVLFAVGALMAWLGRGGFGFGDVKYLAVVGLLLGLQAGLLSLLLAVLLGGLYAAALLATRRAGRKDTIAFGPFIALGSVAVALFVHVSGR